MNVSQAGTGLIKSFVNSAIYDRSMELFMCCNEGDEQSIAETVDTVYQEQKEKGFHHTKYTDTISFKKGKFIAK